MKAKLGKEDNSDSSDGVIYRLYRATECNKRRVLPLANQF